MITIDDLNKMDSAQNKLVRDFIEMEDRVVVRKYLKDFPGWAAKANETPGGRLRDRLLSELTETINAEKGCEISERVVLSELVRSMKKIETVIK